jgi:hypothetical protein
METLLIEIRNPKGMNLIRDLEEMDIIKILKREEAPKSSQKLSELLRGSISAEEAEKFNQYIQESRKEWERDF